MLLNDSEPPNSLLRKIGVEFAKSSEYINEDLQHFNLKLNTGYSNSSMKNEFNEALILFY